MSLFIADSITSVNSLKDKKARNSWEKEFNMHYIQPILGNLDDKVNNAMELIVNDTEQGTSMRLILYSTVLSVV